MSCPEYCRSDQQKRAYCRLERGCGSESSGIGKAIANRLIARGLPISWTRTDRAVDPCTVIGCERTDIEYHHFAPRNTFPDADDWPYLPLCRQHHQYWHHMMDGYRWNSQAPQLNTAHNNQLKENIK